VLEENRDGVGVQSWSFVDEVCTVHLDGEQCSRKCGVASYELLSLVDEYSVRRFATMPQS